MDWPSARTFNGATRQAMKLGRTQPGCGGAKKPVGGKTLGNVGQHQPGGEEGLVAFDCDTFALGEGCLHCLTGS